MNNVLRNKFQAFESTNNQKLKFQEAIACIESIITYYSITFFFHTKYCEYTSKDLVKIIIERFHNRGVLVSAWTDLLNYSLNLLYKKCIMKEASLPSLFRDFIDTTYSIFYENQNPNRSYTFNLFLQCFCKLRNKTIGHGGGNIEQRIIDQYIASGFYKMIYELISYLSFQDKSQLVRIESISPANNQLHLDFIIMSQEIENSNRILVDKSLVFSNLDENELFFYFSGTNSFLSASPFFVYKEGHLRCYNDRDSKDMPTYKDLYGQSEITIKAFKDSFKELLSEDIHINTEPLSAHVVYENSICHNLPVPAYQEFIGRQTLIDNVMKALKHPRLYLISLTGIGGIGKSAIAVRIARLIIEDTYSTKLFSFIIWVSAKRTYLKESGIETAKQTFETLNQLLDLILRITGFNEGLEYTNQKKKQYVIEILSLDSFLIIVDNFETLNNSQEFVDFFEELSAFCKETKIIITSRKQLGAAEKTIDIQEMNKDEYDEYVEYLSQRRYNMPFLVSQKMTTRLYKFTGGMPLATEIILSRSKKIDDLSKAINKIEEDNISKDSILEFSYRESYALLNPSDIKVFYAIAIIPEAKLSTISYISKLHEYDVETSIHNLKQLSFINENASKEETIYTVLPLTRVFIEKTIGDNEAFKSEMSAKLDEYNSIMQEYGFEEYNNLLAITSNSIGVKYAQAAYIQARDNLFAESEENFRKAREISSTDPEVWYLWGMASIFASNSFNKDAFERAISLSDGNLKQRYLLEYSSRLFDLRDYDHCIGNLRKLIKLSPENKSAYHYLGKAYYEKGKEFFVVNNREEMVKCYTQSIAAFQKGFYEVINSEFEQKHNAINCFYLARLEHYLNNNQKSIEYINLGLKYQPNNTQLQKLRQKIYI